MRARGGLALSEKAYSPLTHPCNRNKYGSGKTHSSGRRRCSIRNDAVCLWSQMYLPAGHLACTMPGGLQLPAPAGRMEGASVLGQ
jgi:hypothetical protein